MPRESKPVVGYVWGAIAIFLLVLMGFSIKEWNKSRIVGNKYRSNIVLYDEKGRVDFLSYDPSESQVFAISYPSNLEIKSRSVGSYKIESLYKLGEYEANAGEFVRRKVQGFMRVPIIGFVESADKNGSLRSRMIAALLGSMLRSKDKQSLSMFDDWDLILKSMKYEWRENSTDELVRAGVLENSDGKYGYNQERLAQYLETRVFDWNVGSKDTTVAVINTSGENGLANDVSEYLTNFGFDVVSVKGSDESLDTTKLIVDADIDTVEAESLLSELFGWNEVERGSTDEYRADVVVKLGRDAEQLF